MSARAASIGIDYIKARASGGGSIPDVVGWVGKERSVLDREVVMGPRSWIGACFAVIACLGTVFWLAYPIAFDKVFPSRDDRDWFGPGPWMYGVEFGVPFHLREGVTKKVVIPPDPMPGLGTYTATSHPALGVCVIDTMRKFEGAGGAKAIGLFYRTGNRFAKVYGKSPRRIQKWVVPDVAVDVPWVEAFDTMPTAEWFDADGEGTWTKGEALWDGAFLWTRLVVEKRSAGGWILHSRTATHFLPDGCFPAYIIAD